VSNTIDEIEDCLIFDFHKVEDIINQKRGIKEEKKQIDSENKSDNNDNENESGNDNNENKKNNYKSNED
ncbi:13294_t:CDS:1, partial [Funneliformis geosporum]